MTEPRDTSKAAALDPPRFTHSSPRLFAMYRQVDVTGISSTGIVAYAVRWPDGTATVRWATSRAPKGYHRPVAQSETWDHLEEVMAVHGHHGSTVLVPIGDGPNTPHVLAFASGLDVVAWGIEWHDRRCTTAAVFPDGEREITEWLSPSAALARRFAGCELVRWPV